MDESPFEFSASLPVPVNFKCEGVKFVIFGRSDSFLLTVKVSAEEIV